MRLVLVLLLLTSFSAIGQNYDTTKYFRSKDFGWQWKGGKFDSALLAPRDTVRNKRGLAQIGGTIYVGNGTSWTAAGGNTTTLQQAITASGVLTQNNTIDASGYQLKFIADSLTFDTERLTINNRIFTPGLISGLATDSIVMRNPTTNRLHVVSPSRINALNTLATVTAAGNSTTDSVNIKTVANTPMVTITKRQGTPNLFGEIKLFDSTFSTSVPTVTIYGNSNGGIDASTFNVFNNTKSSRSQINYGGTTGSYIYTLPEATGAAVLSVNSQTANSAGNIALSIFDSLVANTSAGLLIKSHSGSNIAQLGAGGGANVTWFGGNNFNSASGYSTNINGSLSGNNFTTVSRVDSSFWARGGNATTAGFNSRIGTTGATSLRFITNNTVRAIIDSSNGYLGLGTTTPTYPLDIQSASFARFNVQAIGSTQVSFVLQRTVGAAQAYWETYIPTSTQQLRFYNAGGDRMTLQHTGNVSIGTTTDEATAILNASSTNKGFLPPRMTTTQRDAISSPATGLMVYDTTVNKVSVYNGTTWKYLMYE